MRYYSEKEIELLDRLAIKNGLQVRQMMELAGFQMLNLFGILKIDRLALITIVCGKGNNGGDGLCAARFLANNGWKVEIVLATSDLNEDGNHQFLLLKKMGVPVVIFNKNPRKAGKMIDNADIIVDALLGYHISGNPRIPYNEIIHLINRSEAKVLAYDLPSGLSANGNFFEPHIRADYTLTLAVPKTAFKDPIARAESGKVYVADIGIPSFLYDKIQKNSRPDFCGGIMML